MMPSEGPPSSSLVAQPPPKPSLPTDPLEAARLELAHRVLARRRLLPFVQKINPRYIPGWVHEDICRRLERFSKDVEEGCSPRLMLLVPPRHGKSELASRMFPPWHLGRCPDHEFIACSYNVSLAMSFSRKVKEVIVDPVYEAIFDTRLHPDFQAAEEWAIKGHRGGYVAAGVGGGITGKGAHILTIDDPIKNAEEAQSADLREKLWEWYTSTAYTRLAPGGGVLIIQCMTGDTPVRLPDGTEKRLDAIRAGDEVATFDDGRLGVSTVAAWKSSGRDSVYTITMNSGKMVRANGRHPFLVSVAGELKWIRTKHLTTGHTIVVLQDNAASGSVKPVQQTGATSQQSAGASAPPTTTSKNGQTDTALHLPTLSHAALRTSSIATASRLTRTLNSWLRKAAGALSAGVSRMTGRPGTGAENSASTTTTTQVRSAGCCATTATPPQGTPAQSASPSRWLSTSEFTTDAVRSVELTGEEEVFDVQIDRTENFIANGLVSHNTWWHDDDLAGKIQNAMRADNEADQFEIIRYPAIAEHDEYLDPGTDQIVERPPLEYPDLKPLRLKGEALHPARYDIRSLNQIKRTLPQQWWSALYQQNPVPDEGIYFTKDMFRRGPAPRVQDCYVSIAFDFAISEKQQNDYTVGTVSLLDSDDVLHFVDRVRFKSADADYICKAIVGLCKKWHNPSLQLGLEDGQIYRALSAPLKREMARQRVYPSMQLLKPISDKQARARTLQGRMQQGLVSFSSEADWYDSMRTEMLRFPNGVHDDQVDSAAWNAIMAAGRQPPKKQQSRPMKSWKDRLVGAGNGTHMAA